MIIKKILNNNAAIVEKESKEAIVLGSGIGFQKKIGDEIRNTQVEKVFYMNKENQSKFEQLLEMIPIDYFNVTDRIIKHIENELHLEANELMYLVLADHMYYAIERYHNHQTIMNSMYWEIKHFYPKEFEISLDALHIINEHFGVYLPEYEASFITIHVLNMTGQINYNLKDEVTDLKAIVNIVKYHFGKDLDDSSMNYLRFVTHLRYFFQRLNGRSELNKISQSDDLFQLVCRKYFKTYLCIEKIDKYVHEHYNKEISDEEKMYLVLHVERVIANT